MEAVPYHPLLEVTNEEFRSTRKFYDIENIKVLNESLDSVEEWIKKQDHLSEAGRHLDRESLERLFLLSRASVEGTKLKIEKFFTTRGMMPELNLNKRIEEFEKLLDFLIYVPLPKLHPKDNSRVMVTHILSDKSENFSLLSYLRFCFFVGEYRIGYDYSTADRYVIDLKNFNMNLLTKLNPILLKKAEILCTECIGTKIKGIHLLNAPPFVDKIVFILKQGLKEKVASRLTVHTTYEDFHKEVPKEILPKDFDGDGPSLSKLADQWKDMLKSDEVRNVSEKFDKLISDESKRSEMKFNEEYLGMPGSFRKLTVIYISAINFLIYSYGCFLPKLTNDHYRVYAVKNQIKNTVESGFLDYYRFYFMLCEYVQAHDYCNGLVIFVDYSDANIMESIKWITVTDMTRLMEIMREGYGMRIKGIHIYTQSMAIDALVSIMKQGTSPKVANRYKVHKTLESVYDYIPKDILPVEYGGKEKPLFDLHKKMRNIFANEFKDYLEEMRQAGVNENLRTSDSVNGSQYLGISGTFRQLNRPEPECRACGAWCIGVALRCNHRAPQPASETTNTLDACAGPDGLEASPRHKSWTWLPEAILPPRSLRQAFLVELPKPAQLQLRGTALGLAASGPIAHHWGLPDRRIFGLGGDVEPDKLVVGIRLHVLHDAPPAIKSKFPETWR
ncbi:alpha-tocopherol transfer protein [Danaus plexippus plexippus]|uniref:Alpha-tocopherol transfer protein n=1 Tax=Danaus plexippus plexippus TaxID=278856 RepID=A0A212FN46_DANPL|nr:alpha-tocopherol transfer protein [Danaus plexippus plexippus]